MNNKKPGGAGRGFTLIELLVVISIIAVLSSIVLAALSSTRSKAKLAAGFDFADHNFEIFGADAIATYNFSETSGSPALDTSGNNRTITPVTAPFNRISTTPTGQGNSLALGTPNNWASYPAAGNSVPVTTSANSNYTISSWVYFTNLSCSASSCLLAGLENETGPTVPISLTLSAGSLTCHSDAVGGSGSNVTFLPLVGVWYQVACSENVSGSSATLSLYVNGSLAGTPVTATYVAASNSFDHIYVDGGDGSYYSTPPGGGVVGAYINNLQIYQHAIGEN